MTQKTVEQLMKVVPALPAHIAVLIRGDHGIGKSDITRTLADVLAKHEGLEALPVIDRRMSQMTAGDIIGLPKLDGKTTRWCPPDWFMQACESPCVLFLDEINRADVDVMQSAFQLVLDRQLNGFKLHPKTRVFAAVNLASVYQVQQLDPALLDRFYVVDLLPSKPAWVKWAREQGDIHSEFIDWIELNETSLFTPKKYNPSQVVPSPRSNTMWARAIFPHMTECDEKGLTYDSDFIRLMGEGFVGVESAISFIEHLKKTFRFSGHDILNNYKKIQKKINKNRVDVMNAALDKLVEACLDYHVLGVKIGEENAMVSNSNEKLKAEQTALAKKHGENMKLFMYDLQPETRVIIWHKLAEKGKERLDFIMSAHPWIVKPTLDAFGVPLGKAGVGVEPKVILKDKLG
jgi:hypothetical protein